MKLIQRDIYLQKIINRKENSMIKIITGIRRCGKSYLLFKIYYDYLLSIGIKDSQIIKIELDNEQNMELGLNRIENLDIYVTGSNSKFLSSDILTEFRGRGDEIRVYPL